MTDSGEDGRRGGRDRARHPFVVEARQVALGATAAHHADDVDVAAVEGFDGRDDLRGRRVTLHRALHEDDLEAVTGVQQLTGEVAVALGAGTSHQSDAQGHRRDRDPLVGLQQSFGRQACDEFGAAACDVAEQTLHVDLSDGETDPALGRVEVDVPVKVDDESGRQRHAVGGQLLLQRRPLGRPAVRVEDRSFGVRGRGARVHQVDVDVALFVDLGDLAADPVRVTTTEGRFELRREQLVEGADLQDLVRFDYFVIHVARIPSRYNIVPCWLDERVTELWWMVSRLGGRTAWQQAVRKVGAPQGKVLTKCESR